MGLGFAQIAWLSSLGVPSEAGRFVVRIHDRVGLVNRAGAECCVNECKSTKRPVQKAMEAAMPKPRQVGMGYLVSGRAWADSQ